MNYHEANGVEVRIIRIFNTYGPRMDPNDGRVISNFICQALRGEPITIYGDGQQTRSFCYCDDLLEGMMRLMNNDEHVGSSTRKTSSISSRWCRSARPSSSPTNR